MSKIEDIMDEMEEYLNEAKPAAFSNNKKVVVEKEQLLDMLDEMRARTPDEIKKYQKIISNRDSILADAQAQADSIIKQANEQTAHLVSESEIMQKAINEANKLMASAQEQAQKIVDDAVAEANSVRSAAVMYTDEMLSSMQTIISHSLESTRKNMESTLDSLQNSYDVIVSNRNELAGSGASGESAPAKDDAPDDDYKDIDDDSEE